jgi:NAD(P)-dependent dehydrogenase (short-subunit alcohol dehydrogenase family)
LRFVAQLLDDPGYGMVYAACRDPESASDLAALQTADSKLRLLQLDVIEEASIRTAAESIATRTGWVDTLIYCAGVLRSGDSLKPEKRLSEVRPDTLTDAFRVNAFGALLVAREFESLLKAGSRAVFAALSARVGSIDDNRRGGWYAYRSSKAALNMMVKSLAIEWGRFPRPIRCYALHPGTVATDLTAPYRANVDSEAIFTPEFAARQLLHVIDGLGRDESGGFYAYDGKLIPW